jgi:hypothetical protein
VLQRKKEVQPLVEGLGDKFRVRQILKIFATVNLKILYFFLIKLFHWRLSPAT